MANRIFVEFLGSGTGFLYGTDTGGTVIKSVWSNSPEGAVKMLQDAAVRGNLRTQVGATGTITVVSGDGTDIVTGVTIDGVAQITGTVAEGATTTLTATAITTAINAFVPATGPAYTAMSIANVVTVFAPVSFGDTVNGDLVAVTTSDPTLNVTTTNMIGGSNETTAYSSVFGRRFFINNDFDGNGCAGVTVATPTSLTNAQEISTDAIKQYLNSSIDVTTPTISAGSLDITRTSSTMDIKAIGEGAVADDLHTILTAEFSDGDRLYLMGGDAAQVITVQDNAVGGGNIYTDAAVSFITSTLDGVIVLRKDGTNWYEVGRAIITPTVAALREAGTLYPVVGTTTVTVPTSGTLSLTPGTTPGHQILTGSATLIGAYTIQGAGSPADGDEFIIENRATADYDSNVVTVMGIVIPELLEDKLWTVTAVYDGPLGAYRSTLAVDYTETVHIIAAMLAADSVTLVKILDTIFTADASGRAKFAVNFVNQSLMALLSVGTPELIDDSVTPLKGSDESNTELLVVDHISFETDEIGDHKIVIPYNCTVVTIDYYASKLIEVTDDGTVIAKDNAAATMATTTVTGGTAVGSGPGTETPVANNTFSEGEVMTFTTSKVTQAAGGYVRASVQIIKT